MISMNEHTRNQLITNIRHTRAGQILWNERIYERASKATPGNFNDMSHSLVLAAKLVYDRI